MKLSHILNEITNLQYSDCSINSIHLDSRTVKENGVFIAVNGQNVDARRFIPNVLKQNIAAILAQTDKDDHIKIQENIQIIYIKDLNEKVSAIASNFYNNPTKKAKVAGITGTNGKTTVCQLVAEWSELLGNKSATLGTIGNGLSNKLKKAENTTGSPLEIQQEIAEFVEKGANLIAMEVCSHGLIQNRISAVNFDVVAFTNLTQDHLDYHRTMNNYFNAKALLFTEFSSKYEVINIDDDFGLDLCHKIIGNSSTIAVSCKNKDLKDDFTNYIYLSNVDYVTNGSKISIKSSFSDEELTFNSQLLGPFNVSNMLMALGIMLGLGFNIKDLIKTAAKLTPVIGRMEVFSAENQATLIVDYAHTPDALEKALKACKIHTIGNLKCIFGCGGDRDKTKRPLMAKVAEKIADEIIITDDNPRTEAAENIIKDITNGLKKPQKAKIIQNRFDAIKTVLANSNKDDIILIAGKGHEDYQLIGNTTVHYSDRESAQKLLGLN